MGDDRFNTEAVFTETLSNDAFSEQRDAPNIVFRLAFVLVSPVKHAFVAERFKTEAVCMLAFNNEAFVETCTLLCIVVNYTFAADRYKIDAVFMDTL